MRDAASAFAAGVRTSDIYGGANANVGAAGENGPGTRIIGERNSDDEPDENGTRHEERSRP
jgi:hypothetical protein